MAFSRETFENLWGLEYATFDPRATYSMHPIIFLEDDDTPLADSYELGQGAILRFRELGAIVGRAERFVERANVQGVLAGVVLTSTLETRQFAASVLVTPANAQRVPVRSQSFITWRFGPTGSGMAKHKDWWRRAIEPSIAINRMPEPVGYADPTTAIVACVPTRVLAKPRRPHLPIYRPDAQEPLLVNVLSSDQVAMRRRLTGVPNVRANMV